MGLASMLPSVFLWIIGYGLLAILVASVLYSFVIYQLFFHPLRKVPEPWLAAATSWYVFYRDIILGGHYVKEYPKIHAKYGQSQHSAIDQCSELKDDLGTVVRGRR